MGAFTNSGENQPPVSQQEEPEVTSTETPEKSEEPTGFNTDVEGVMADGEYPHGNERFPIFKVDKDEFYQNMQYGRKRLRFKSGTNAQKYMSGTKYQRPFYISYTDSKGKTFSRKVK